MLRTVGLILLLTTTMGCSTTKSLTNRDCPLGEGAYCKSASEVNAMIDRGELPRKKEEKQNKNKNRKVKLEFDSSRTAHPEARIVKRIPEKTMRVWFNSFTDEFDDFVQEGYTHTVIAPGKWREE